MEGALGVPRPSGRSLNESQASPDESLCAALFASPLWEAHVAGAPFAGLAARVLILEFAPFFSIGILFYRLYRNQGAAAWNHALIAAALAVIMASQPFAVSLLIVAACSVLWKLAHGGLPALRFRPLVFVGTISYSLYLLHQKIGYSLMLSLLERGWSAGAAMAVAATLSIGLATAVTFLVEKPALHAIRRRYKALRARAAAQAGNAGHYMHDQRRLTKAQVERP